MAKNEARPKRIKKYRMEKGISIYELADIVGANFSTISYWEMVKDIRAMKKLLFSKTFSVNRIVIYLLT